MSDSHVFRTDVWEAYNKTVFTDLVRFVLLQDGSRWQDGIKILFYAHLCVPSEIPEYVPEAAIEFLEWMRCGGNMKYKPKWVELDPRFVQTQDLTRRQENGDNDSN